MKAKKYDFSKIEKKWQKKWRDEGTYEPDLEGANKPFYNLMMFPYPSAEGLHVGNMYAFTGSDIYGRMKRMQGYDVFEPIGLDGFGIHSENYALKIGTHPMKQAKVSEKRFYKQLEAIGNGFAWDERLETYDPDYYKWTQWIFIQLFKRGLAYRKKQAVNWCPSCKTVLADEQAINGRCERCSTEVIKKELEQWFFKITVYAERLLKNLEKIDWSERVKIAQKNWIGKSEGLIFSSPVKDTKMTIETFSAHFEAFTADTFVVIAPDHPLLPKLLEGTPTKNEVLAFCEKIISKRKKEEYREKEAEGIFTGRYTVDPVGNGNLPIWVASYALAEYGTGIVKCSAHDERDFAFAKKYGLRLKPTLLPPDQKLREDVSNLKVCYSDTQNGILNEPAVFKGKRAGDVREGVIRYCVGNKLARPITTYRLRDWLISRQRYWGPPIPMIYCETCAKNQKGERNDMAGWYTVLEKDLPVKLPLIKEFRPKGKGESPLASSKAFYKVKCPHCGEKARRETDVSDTFLDSAWYYLRYPSVRSAHSGQAPWDPEITKHWLPVNMYIGGAEHSVLHLLYSRFLAMAFHDWGLLDFKEPFTTFRAHGLLIKEGAKMSKSKGNVVNPDLYIKKFGADTLRMYLMFLAPFEQGGDFRDAAILGISRFLERVWKFHLQTNSSEHYKSLPNKDPHVRSNSEDLDTFVDLNQLLHRTIKKVTEDIEHLQYNTAISALMILLNEFEKSRESLVLGHRLTFLKLLAPFAPYITEELWHELGDKTSIHEEAWPTYDAHLIEEHEIDLVVQVNGKSKTILKAARDITESQAESLARSASRIEEMLRGKTVKKIIFVKGRLINFVLSE